METTIKEEKYAEKMLADYSPEKKEGSDYEALKALEKKVTKIPTINAWVIGSVFTLVFGFGFCLVMKALTFEGLDWLGYVLGGVGILGLIGNPFIYHAFIAHQKEKYGPAIVELSKKILG
jgi:hypothetical protein